MRTAIDNENLILYAGHHRLKAFLSLSEVQNTEPLYFCHCYDLDEPGVLTWLQIISINAVDLTSVPDFFHVAFARVFPDSRLRMIKAGGTVTDEEFAALRLKGLDKTQKWRLVKVIEFYSQHPAIWRKFEEATFQPLFESQFNDYHGNFFNISFCFMIVTSLPSTMVDKVATVMFRKWESNKLVLKALLSFIGGNPFLAVLKAEKMDIYSDEINIPNVSSLYLQNRSNVSF